LPFVFVPLLEFGLLLPLAFALALEFGPLPSPFVFSPWSRRPGSLVGGPLPCAWGGNAFDGCVGLLMVGGATALAAGASGALTVDPVGGSEDTTVAGVAWVVGASVPVDVYGPHSCSTARPPRSAITTNACIALGSTATLD
jgi:hypothetical protein